MDLYLVRHGKAEQGIADDAARRLTDKGRKAVQRVARRLAEAGVQIDRIEHSGLVRAQETAEILAEGLGGEVAVAGDLAPDAGVEPVVARLEGGEHTPTWETLSRLAREMNVHFVVDVDPKEGAHLRAVS